MKEDIEDKNQRLLDETKRISMQEACGMNIMNGFGIRNIVVFANSIGFSASHIGFLSAFPELVNGVSQLFSPRLMEKYSRKQVVFLAALFQAIMWIPIVLIAFFFTFKTASLSPYYLIAIYTILLLFGSILTPAWSSWMKDIIGKRAGDYFSKRSFVSVVVSLLSFMLAGLILDYSKKTNLFIGFIVIFSIAFLGRMFSSLSFLRQHEPDIEFGQDYYFSFLDFVKRMIHNNFGKFTLFISVFYLTTQIGSPFFAIYLLNNLNLKSLTGGYFLYTVVSMAVSISTLASLRFWGRFSDKYGNLKTVRISSYPLSFIPIFWASSYFLIGNISVYLVVLFLFLTQLLSGFFWAGFALSSRNFIYDAVTRQRIALCVAYSNILTGIGIFIGASLGGLIMSIDFAHIVAVVFLVSAVFRLIVVIFFSGKIKEVREVDILEFRQIKHGISYLPKFPVLGLLSRAKGPSEGALQEGSEDSSI